jgi:hypothetical protein
MTMTTSASATTNVQDTSDTESITSEITIPNILKKDWIQKLIQKTKKAFESDETRKMMQVFLFDPVLNYVLERLFPYLLIACVMFVLLTVMVSAIVVFIFMKMPLFMSKT